MQFSVAFAIVTVSRVYAIIIASVPALGAAFV